MTLPLVGITMGDPAGIGPEVLAKHLQAADCAGVRLLLIGSDWALAEGAAAADLASAPLPTFDSLDDMPNGGAVAGILDVGVSRPPDFRHGRVQAACGHHAVRAVEAAAALCLDGRLAAMVTCPINKEAIHAAGYVDDIGHQEILARLTGSASTATMLMTPGLKVVHLSTHKPLIEAARYATRANVGEKLGLIHESLERWGLRQPRIAVAALNPHGGEGGLLGREEIDELAPAVADARRQGLDATGPIPADSVFNRAIGGEFDVVLALYHDQGHIAVKVHDFHQSTTATLGIPFVRTSVDHGTAFDIAGLGRADNRGLAAAIEAAQSLVERRLR
ncbi:MAG: 4-hydroxythreonine-4-phosphate dehydrogenase PdxA [Gammaproteobacteria bacterium]|nr:4-hydroxythreonine-4-phosphate dehydrogenase PdxA [Gammaproteobacteria bacterium]